jgi:hypothetical protein
VSLTAVAIHDLSRWQAWSRPGRAPRVFTSLTTGQALPLVVVSVLAGAAVLILLVLDTITVIRPLAVIAVVAVAAGWGLHSIGICCRPA